MSRQIFEQSEKLLQEKHNNEMLNVIYDTLLQNSNGVKVCAKLQEVKSNSEDEPMFVF